ncbi:MAG TPA: sigma-70 family RNA polymerase sigma factor [Opitutaceae bacterium]|nr:sigma-70 family RNA polymerase sigma factor [Opitutaceae bacterium]
MFPSTHWSVVLLAGAAGGPEARSALETLCRQYWYPLYAFVRRQGRTHHEAQDCTQEFLARLLAADGIARARPERGRFRTFLLTALRNFLTDEWHRTQAAKRGGGQVPLPLEFDTAGERYAREPADAGLTPEQAFDRRWALDVVEKALLDLRVEYAASGRGALFDALAPVIWGGGAREPPAAQAQQLGLNDGAYKVALHRLRKRLRERLQAQVAATVADDTEIEEELRYLITAVGGMRPPV